MRPSRLRGLLLCFLALGFLAVGTFAIGRVRASGLLSSAASPATPARVTPSRLDRALAPPADRARARPPVEASLFGTMPRLGTRHRTVHRTLASDALTPAMPATPPDALQQSSFLSSRAPASSPGRRRGPEPVLIDLQFGRLVSRTVPAIREGEEVLLPMGRFLELAEIGYTLSPAGVLELHLQPSGIRIRIAAGADTMSAGDRRVGLAPGDLVFQDGELYLASRRLSELLGLEFAVDWPDLIVAVTNPEILPVARRLKRESQRDALIRRQQGVTPDLVVGQTRRPFEGVLLDYAVSFPLGQDPVGRAAYSLGLGSGLAGGSLELGLRSVGTVESGETDFDASWTGVWRDSKWVKQLRLGDGPLTGPRFRSVRGASVTNAPFLRPSHVGSLRYYGDLPAGWQLEAYQGGQLVAFDSVDAFGRYALELPVGYGDNPVDFVAYGPAGEIREFNRTYKIIGEQLPSGRFEYGVAGGECGDPLCEAAANVDLRYGISRRLTVRGGAERYWRDSLSSLMHPYALATGLLGNAVALEGEVVGNAYVRGGARFEPSIDFRLGAEYARFELDVEQPVITQASRRGLWVFDAFVRPLASEGSFYLEGQAQIDDNLGQDVTRARVRASVQAGGARLYPYARLDRIAPTDGPAESREFLGVNAFAMGRPSWGPLRNLWFRGDLEMEATGGMNLAAGYVARSLGPALRVELGAAWREGTSGTLFSLTLNSYLPSMRASTLALRPTVGEGSTVQSFQGSVIYDDSRNRLTTAPGPSLERSGVSGRVFVDRNGNGRPEVDEEGVYGVRVVVGSQVASTDSLGRFRVWDLPAFEPVQVEIDSLSLDNPLYVPAISSASVAPPPNAVRELNLPLVPGAILEGRVVRGPERRPVGSITLNLIDRATGRRRQIATFVDGSFYAMGVRPGEYDLEVDPRDLAARRLRGRPLRIQARVDEPESLAGLELVVEEEGPPPR